MQLILKRNLDNIKKRFKVFQTYDILSSNLNKYQYKTYKEKGSYHIEVYKLSLGGEFEFRSYFKIKTRKELEENLISCTHYFYDL